MLRVMVLGAYGSAGRAVVSSLAALDEVDLVAGGRRASPLEGLAAQVDKLHTVVVDAHDRQSLHRALTDVDVVINCIGPYIGNGLHIIEAAVDAHTHYVDLASEQEHLRRALRFGDAARAAGVTVLVGAGAYPGLSGLLLQTLLAAMPDATRAELALITAHPREGEAGPAQVESGLLELGYPHQALVGGRLEARFPGSRRAFDFGGGFQRRTLMEWPQLEVIWAGLHTDLTEMSTWVCLDGQPPTPRWLLRAVSWLGLHRPTRRSAWLRQLVLRTRLRPETEQERAVVGQGALFASVAGPGGERTLIATIDDVAWATAWLPTQLVRTWSRGALPAGVRTPMDVLSASEQLHAFRAAPGVRVAER